jgi:uncharacterized protein with ParB-like and HNH nuclease domain
MQSELKSLSKIFSEVIFRIPDYQRGYSWEIKHLKDFWNDIEQLPDAKSHYTGVLTLEPVSEENYKNWEDDLWIIESKRYNPMYVVDGQQRLTTAIILLQCILDKIPEDQLLNFTEKSDIRKKYICEAKGKGISKSYIFGYEKDNPSHEFLKQKIFGDESVLHGLSEETIYTKNLVAAKDFFNEKLIALTIEDLEYIFTTLTQHLQFNIFYIEKDLDVFVTFETMNNRGKPLSHLELMKNRLIYLSTKFNVEKSESNQLRKAINESWKSIYHFLGKTNRRKLDDDDFLRTHFISYFGSNLSSESGDPTDFRRYLNYTHEYKDYLLDEVFTPKRLVNHSAGQVNVNELMSDDCSEAVEGEEATSGIKSKNLDISEVYDYSQSIKSLVKTYYQIAHPEDGEWTDFEKLKLSQINRLDDTGIFMVCTAIMHKTVKSESRESALTAIERFGFLFKLKRYFFEFDMVATAGKLFSGKLQVDALTKRLTESGDAFAKSKDFKDAMTSIGKPSGSGYYAWKQLRYFMYEYEQELRAQSKTSRQLLKWSEDVGRENFEKDHKTIEHIYPQKAEGASWKSPFVNYSVKQRNILKNSLGNLLPVSHGKNASLSNKSFDLKKGDEAQKVGFRYGCLSEIQVATNDDWTAKEILRRGIYLLDFLEKRWGVSLGNAKNKVSILGLEFVLDIEKTNLASILAIPPIVPSPPPIDVENRADSISL